MLEFWRESPDGKMSVGAPLIIRSFYSNLFPLNDANEELCIETKVVNWTTGQEWGKRPAFSTHVSDAPFS